jgi:hypothetical protein
MKTQLNRILIIKNFILLLSFLFIFSSCCTKQEQVSNEEIEQTILTLEKNVLDKWSNGDPIPFSKNFAPDATLFDDIGAQMRLNNPEEITNYLASFGGKIPAHQYKLIAPKVQVYGDIAILTFQYHATMPDNEQGTPWKVTSVYRLKDGKWQVVHAHWSLVKEQ